MVVDSVPSNSLAALCTRCSVGEKLEQQLQLLSKGCTEGNTVSKLRPEVMLVASALAALCTRCSSYSLH